MSRARDRADSVLHNRTHEDTEGGRESIVTFKGEQSGGEISTLAQSQASHDGTADDQKADLIFKTNDGSDNAAPTERLRIDSDGNVGINATPFTKLNVYGDNNSNVMVVDAQGTAPNYIFDVRDDGTSKLRVNGDGNLLLGTAVTGRAAEGADRLTIADASHSGMTIRSGVNSYGSINFSDSEGGAGEYAGQLWYGHGSLGDKLVMAVGGSNKVTVDGDGLKFNSDTAAANALNDYETGTFQMSVGGVSGGARGSGIYTKIGEMVHFQWYSGAMTVTSSSPVLTGLPFNSTDPFNNAAYAGFFAYHNTYVTNANTGYINLNSTSLYFTALGSTGGPTISTGSSKYIMVSGTYYTNA